MERKVLFATDLNGDVDAGLELASRAAAERRAELLIVHVISAGADDGVSLLTRALDAEREAITERMTQLVPPDLSVPFRHVVLMGSPERRIVELAERERVDLLVVGLRDRPGLRRLLGPGLGERLLHRSPCPTLTYRERPSAERRSPSSQPLAVSEPSAPNFRPSLQILRATLRARVTALEHWLQAQEATAAAVASRKDVRDRIAALRAQDDGSAGRILGTELEELCRAIGGLGYAVIDASGKVLLGDAPDPSWSVETCGFLKRVLEGGPRVSLPVAELEDPGTGRKRCRMLAAAPVYLDGPEPESLIVFSLDAEREFLRILALPGAHASAETYAFDARGVMLSYSRFPEQLRRVGLLPAHSHLHTPLSLRVCDPGGNLLDGFRPQVPFEQLPLTHMAAQATSGVSGFDLNGYRDYRGVEVVGTWQWLGAYGFGIAAEIDRAEAS